MFVKLKKTYVKIMCKNYEYLCTLIIKLLSYFINKIASTYFNIKQSFNTYFDQNQIY